MTKILTSCLLLVLFSSSAYADTYEVYLLAGQSNMDGRGRSSELSEADQGPVPHAIIFYRNIQRSSDGWQPLTIGFSVPPNYKGELPSPTFGPEIGFSREMMRLRQDASHPTAGVAIIKGSNGGTNLRVDWNPGTRHDLESQGPRYRDFIETIQLAKAFLSQNGDGMIVRGLLWHQGEADSKSSSAKHEKRLKELIARFREDLEMPNLPIVLGQVYDNGKRDSVREAIGEVSEGDPLVGLVTVEGLTTWDEGTHFDGSSQLELGKRFAKELRRIRPDVPLQR